MRILPLLIMPIFVVACSAGPAFQASGDHEEGADVPCHNAPGWHRCLRAPMVCCPNGMSCGDDDFVPRKGVCRSW